MSDAIQTIASGVEGSVTADDRKLAQRAVTAPVVTGALPNVTQCYIPSNLSGTQPVQVDATRVQAVEEEQGTPPQTSLTVRQRAALELIAMGKPDSFVAAEVQVHLKTITRWRLYHAAFRAELARRQQEVWGAACERVRGMLDISLDIFTDHLTSNDKMMAYRCARTLLMLSRHFAPPSQPIDPMEVLTAQARRMKRADMSEDPMIQCVDEDELQSAAENLTHKLQGQELPGSDKSGKPAGP